MASAAGAGFKVRLGLPGSLVGLDGLGLAGLVVGAALAGSLPCLALAEFLAGAELVAGAGLGLRAGAGLGLRAGAALVAGLEYPASAELFLDFLDSAANRESPVGLEFLVGAALEPADGLEEEPAVGLVSAAGAVLPGSAVHGQGIQDLQDSQVLYSVSQGTLVLPEH